MNYIYITKIRKKIFETAKYFTKKIIPTLKEATLLSGE